MSIKSSNGTQGYFTNVIISKNEIQTIEENFKQQNDVFTVNDVAYVLKLYRSFETLYDLRIVNVDLGDDSAIGLIDL